MVGVKRRCNLRRMSHEVGEMNENEMVDLSSQYASDLVKFQQVQWLRSAYGFGYRYSETTEDTDRFDNDYERRTR